MKIRLYSWFISGNIGDILISEQFINFFNSEEDYALYDVSTFEKVDNSLLVKRKSKKTFKSIILSIRFLRNIISYIYSFKKEKIKDDTMKCDIAILAGGNILMDLNSIGAVYLKRLYNHISILKRKGSKICFLCTGAGPINSCSGFKYLRKILELSDFISVRDEFSYALCRKYTLKDIYIWRDPVLVKEPLFLNNHSNSCIAINVFFGNAKMNKRKIINSYVSLIKHFQKEYSNYRIVLFTTETNDYWCIDEIKNKVVQNEMLRIEYLKSAQQIYEIYSSSVFVFGMRMHSVILSMIYKKSFVCVGWQSKVKSLIDYFNCCDRYISMSTFCNDIKRINEIIENNFTKTLDDKIIKKITELKKENKIFLDRFLEKYCNPK